MAEVEIFGGKNDGQIINVEERLVRLGYMRIPNFKPRAYMVEEPNPEQLPSLDNDDIETWKITRFMTATGALKLKAVESGMWGRLNK